MERQLTEKLKVVELQQVEIVKLRNERGDIERSVSSPRPPSGGRILPSGGRLPPVAV